MINYTNTTGRSGEGIRLEGANIIAWQSTHHPKRFLQETFRTSKFHWNFECKRSVGEGIIDKVGALILVDRKILLARPKDKDAFLIPGGKRERGESDEQTLRREIREELGTEITSMKHYGTFQDQAVFSLGAVKIAAYLCSVKSKMKPQSEIEEIRFFGKDELQKLSKEYIGSVMKNHILPKLIDDGLL